MFEKDLAEGQNRSEMKEWEVKGEFLRHVQEYLDALSKSYHLQKEDIPNKAPGIVVAAAAISEDMFDAIPQGEIAQRAAIFVEQKLGLGFMQPNQAGKEWLEKIKQAS